MIYRIRSLGPAVPSISAGAAIGPSVWQDIYVGGGGFNRGMDVHPDGTAVTWVDVYGGYIGDVKVPNTRWQNVCTTSRFPSNYYSNQYYMGAGVLSMKIAPSNSSVIYMQMGTPYWSNSLGAVLATTNKGASWFNTNFGAFRAQANSGNPENSNGRIGIDPFDPSVVYIGTQNIGLFKSTNGLAGGSTTWVPVNPGVFAPTISTSSSSATIANNSSVTITIGTGLSVSGELLMWNTANPANYMFGDVTNYNSGTGSLTISVTGAGGSGTFSSWTVGQGSDPGITAICIDPNSGTTGGQASRIILHVQGGGIYVSANAGGSWSLIASSPTSYGKGKLGADSTYYLSQPNTTALYRLTTGNVLTNIAPGAGDGQAYTLVAIDPNDATRVIADRSGGFFNVPTSAVNTGSPTWTGWNFNHHIVSGAGQPKWQENAQDQFMTDGEMFVDPLSATSSSSMTIGNGSHSCTIQTGLSLAVGDCIRAFNTGTPANFMIGYVTSYNSGTGALTFALTKDTSSTSVAYGTGSKTFTVSAGQSYIVGQIVVAYDTTNNNNSATMTGTVTSYSGTTLVINVTSTNSGGTFSGWNILQGTFGGSGTFSSWTIGRERMWFAWGCGVSYTDGFFQFGQQQWQTQFYGLENIVCSQLNWGPGQTAPISATWDRPFFNLPSTPNAYPQNYYPYVTYGQNAVIFGASIDWAKTDPTFLVGLYARNTGGCYSSNYGTSWTDFTTTVPGNSGINGGGGTIIAMDTNKFVVARQNSQGIYQTQDRGVTWTAITGAPTSGWGGNDLQSQFHILCKDQVTSNVCYAYNNSGGATSGLWVSTDGGISMVQGSSGQLGPVDGFLAQLKSVPGNSGHLFFTNGALPFLGPHPASSSLYRTTNALAGAGAVTWTTVSNVLEVITIGFGKALAGGYPAIYIVGWVTFNGGASYQFGIYRSDDNCSTWTKIGDFPERNGLDPPTEGGWFDHLVDIVGNPNRWNSCAVGFNGSTLGYYGPLGSY